MCLCVGVSCMTRTRKKPWHDHIRDRAITSHHIREQWTMICAARSLWRLIPCAYEWPTDLPTCSRTFQTRSWAFSTWTKKRTNAFHSIPFQSDGIDEVKYVHVKCWAQLSWEILRKSYRSAQQIYNLLVRTTRKIKNLGKESVIVSHSAWGILGNKLCKWHHWGYFVRSVPIP